MTGEQKGLDAACRAVDLKLSPAQLTALEELYRPHPIGGANAANQEAPVVPAK